MGTSAGAGPDGRPERTRIESPEEIADDAVHEDVEFAHVRIPGRRLRRVRFVDCVWTGADLSGFVPDGCVFQGCRFEDCKAIGIDWTAVERVTACEFHRCLLDDGAFLEMQLRGAVFRECRMRGVVLTGADLTGASLRGCDLRGATFGRTTLVRADLREATGFLLHPTENSVKGLRVSAEAAAGILAPLGIEIV